MQMQHWPSVMAVAVSCLGFSRFNDQHMRIAHTQRERKRCIRNALIIFMRQTIDDGNSINMKIWSQFSKLFHLVEDGDGATERLTHIKHTRSFVR